jgi:hypothetical protein
MISGAGNHEIIARCAAQAGGKWSAKAFWRVFALSIVIPLILAVGMNIIVDPFGIYGTGLFKPYRANSYVEKAELFAALNPPPEALVIGSSRTGSVDPDLVYELTGERCFNWSVPSAGIEVANAIIRMAVDERKAPIDLVILGVDPDAFTPRLWIHPQAQQAPMYDSYLGRAGLRPKLKAFVNSALRLLTMEQVDASFKVIMREMGDTRFAELELYRPDGMALYTPKEEAIAKGEFDLNAIIDERLETYPEENPCITSSTVLSQDRMDLWMEILDYCGDHGIKVYAFLPPGHPRYNEMLEEFGAGPKMEEIRSFLEESLNDHDDVFRDYADLESFDGDPNQFYDEVHMREENNSRLIRDLLAGFDRGGS